MFQDSEKLQKLLALRSKYLIHIVGEALKIASFQIQLPSGVGMDRLLASLHHMASCGEGKLQTQLIFFDLAQSTTSWPTAWSTLLAAEKDGLEAEMLQQVPVLKAIPWDEEDKLKERLLRSFLPASACLETQVEQAAIADDEDGAKTIDGDGKVSGESKDSGPSLKISVRSLNTYSDFADSKSGIMDGSFDALGMRISALDTTFLSALQASLQHLIWQLYGEYLRKHRSALEVEIDISKKGADAIVISKETAMEDSFSMMMAGTVSLCAQGQLGKDCYPLCNIFGVQFYLNGPKDLASLDVVVPAWSAKVTSRNDQVFFEQESDSLRVMLYLPKDGKIEVVPTDQTHEPLKKLLRTRQAYSTASETVRQTIEQDLENVSPSDDSIRPWFKAASTMPKSSSSSFIAEALEFEIRLLDPKSFLLTLAPFLLLLLCVLGVCVCGMSATMFAPSVCEASMNHEYLARLDFINPLSDIAERIATWKDSIVQKSVKAAEQSIIKTLKKKGAILSSPEAVGQLEAVTTEAEQKAKIYFDSLSVPLHRIGSTAETSTGRGKAMAEALYKAQNVKGQDDKTESGKVGFAAALAVKSRQGHLKQKKKVVKKDKGSMTQSLLTFGKHMHK